MKNNPALTVRAALSETKARLTVLTGEPALEAQVLLGDAMDKSRTWLFAHPDSELTPTELEKLTGAVQQIEAGIPLPYVLGHWEFYGLDFKVTPDVLIPRPETELLVETALDWLRKNPNRRTAADIGAGSGCIAVTLAVHAPDLTVFAGDISRKALEVTRANVLAYQVENRLSLFQGCLGQCLRGPIDLVSANLPYIPTQTMTSLDVYRREPTLALDGGVDGLALIRSLVEDAPRWLAPGGLLLAEIEERQGRVAMEIARRSFPNAATIILQDLAGKDRLLRVDNA